MKINRDWEEIMNITSIIERLDRIEKKIDRNLYSSGPYWDYKNRRTIYQLKKKNLKNLV